MKRVVSQARQDWVRKVEEFGLIYHHNPDMSAYWKEDVHYSFTVADIEAIEEATNRLWANCLDAVQYIIEKRKFDVMGIPAQAIPLIVRSWENDAPSIYGRFDLAFRPGEFPKMLECNADTPTMLLEASIIQWQWLQEVFPGKDQFNSIHEHLIEKWNVLREGGYVHSTIHFAHLDHPEDLMTTTYLQDTAQQVGFTTTRLLIRDIGWNGENFTDPTGKAIRTLFKLYPWENLWRDSFMVHLTKANTQWMEPAWRLLLSNKAILAVLWELFPEHPNLLPAYLDTPKDLKSWVRKPAYGREGCNIAMKMPRGVEFETGGPYGDQRPWVYQQYVDTTVPGTGNGPAWSATIGSWVIDEQAAGMGVREVIGPIIRNESPFVPHVIE